MGKIFAVVSIDTDALTYAHCYKDDDNADDKLYRPRLKLMCSRDRP